MDKNAGSEILSRVNIIVSRYGILFVLIAIIAIAGLNSPAFFTVINMLNIVRQVAVLGLLSVGMTFVIISGGIDLSVGSILSLCGVVAVSCMEVLSIPVSIIIALAVGMACGALNGLIISKVGGAMGIAFIITFGALTAYASVALMFTNGAILQAGIYEGYEQIGQGSVGIVPISTLILAAAMTGAHFLLSQTTFGRLVYCIGINDEASRLSGIKTKKTRLMVYLISGLMAAIAALVLTSRVKSASPTAGAGYELDVIAAVVLGGTRIGGGAGGIGKTLIGVIIFGVLANALNVMGVSAYPQIIIRGVIIVISVLMDLRSSKIENEILSRS